MTDPPLPPAADYLLSRINYERHPHLATRGAFKQERVGRLLSEIGNPQEKIPAVHIAGTKGKGSTAAMVAAALAAAGIRTGLYTSPHVESFTERLQIDGRSPTPAEFDDLLPPIAAAIARLDAESPELAATYFEVLTAMAWEYFRRENVQIVVLEVGLGGRLDATNICRPEVTAITNISYDHTHILGNTLAKIAAEKAGIIKPGIPCVSGVRQPDAAAVVRDIAARHQAPLIDPAGRFGAIPPAGPAEPWSLEIREPLPDTRLGGGGRWRVPLLGAHQVDNAAVAYFLLEVLAGNGWPVGTGDIASGWRSLSCPARIEVFAGPPAIILDAAHNHASAEALARTLENDIPADRRILLFAGSREKDVANMLRQLDELFEEVVLTAYENNPRAMDVSQLKELWQAITDRPARTCPGPAAALELCRELSGPRDLICVTGSFFLAAEIRPLLAACRKAARGL